MTTHRLRATVIGIGVLMVAGCAGTAAAPAANSSSAIAEGSSSSAVASVMPSAVGSVPTSASTADSTASDSTATDSTATPMDAAGETFAPATDVVDSEGGSTNPLCDMFTVSEVEAVLGAPVDAGADAAMGTGCQWDGTGGASSTYLQIQVIDDPTQYVEQSEGEGFEKLSGIGDAAFVIPELGGFAASAQTATATFAVAVNGGTASKASAAELLKQVIARY